MPVFRIRNVLLQSKYCKSTFYIENPFFNGFLKIISAQNQKKKKKNFCLTIIYEKKNIIVKKMFNNSEINELNQLMPNTF